ncbi:CRE-EFN-2 protein [Aphelenchoides avenae]|nr:CRE-EFN-2 protein [Aphelenchus avenae]
MVTSLWQLDRFDISNTDHVKRVRLLDRVTIFCPHPSQLPYEYTKLYVVSREAYDNCYLPDDRKPLGVCATDDQQSSISVVFRDFSPLPSALEFHPGQSYYVITTSDGTPEGLNATAGGLCVTKNMKMKFEVESDQPAVQEQGALSTLRAALGLSRPAEPASSSMLVPTAATTLASATSAPQITYIIHTVDPDAYRSSNGEGPATRSEEIQGEPDAASRTTSNSLAVILIVFLLVDLSWRRLAA